MNYKIEKLAQAYQDILGSNYYSIEINSSLSLEGNVVQGILKPYRRPYKLENIGAETVEVVLEFYVSVRSEDLKLRTLQDISKLCGYVKGTFNSDDKVYRFNSFLDFMSPATAPVENFGDYTQVVMLAGTCLITQEYGALLGNEISTELVFYAGQLNELRGDIQVLNALCTLVCETESPQMSNQAFAQSFNKARIYQYTYEILVLKNEICEHLVQIATQAAHVEQNVPIQVIEHFPAFSDKGFNVTHNCIITGLTLGRQAGAFTTLSLVLQDALEFQENSPEVM